MVKQHGPRYGGIKLHFGVMNGIELEFGSLMAEAQTKKLCLY